MYYQLWSIYCKLFHNVQKIHYKTVLVYPELLKVLVLNTIFFNLNHDVVKIKNITAGAQDGFTRNYGRGVQSIDFSLIVNADPIPNRILMILPLLELSTHETFKHNLVEKFLSSDNNEEIIQYIKEHSYKVYLISLYIHKYKIYDSTYRSLYGDIQKINNFISTGIL